MATKVVVPPTTEPISLAEAKAHLRVDGISQDIEITRWIKSAREWTERYLERFIALQTVELALDGWTDAIRLNPSYRSMVSLRYLDHDGAEQTIPTSDFIVDDYTEDVWLLPVLHKPWPSVPNSANVIRVRYVAGFPSGSVPEPMKSAMLLLIGDYSLNREAQSQRAYNQNQSVMNLLSIYRVNMGF